MLKASLVWSSPNPERTIAVAMRRCYSTKTIEEIESELDQKGSEYWKYLLTRCLEDKSLDVLEHFTLSLLIEGLSDAKAGKLARRFPYLRILALGSDSWLVSLNARTLVELWRDLETKDIAVQIISELDTKGVCPVFNRTAFGERVNAR
jgi:hypothetical protein